MSSKAKGFRLRAPLIGSILFVSVLRASLLQCASELTGPFARPEVGSVSRHSDPPVRERPQIEAGFRLLYELKFPEARAQFATWSKSHSEDPLGPASTAAAILFEEFYRRGILSSEFFLNDKRLLGGVAGKPDEKVRAAFTASVESAQSLARDRLKKDGQDTDALFALTITTGMQADYASLIERHQLESLHLLREAERYAKDLLAVEPDSADAYLALGAANYILGCLPAYKRFFLRIGGVRGDKAGGMEQLQIAAARGHYLRPYAKLLVALAALREKQVDVARNELRDLTREFPENPLFRRELARLTASPAQPGSSP